MTGRRLVIKIGTHTLLQKSKQLPEYFREFFDALEELMRKDYRPLLVLSGAVATGKTRQFTSSQARAAVGQMIILHIAAEEAARCGVETALLLLSREDIVNRTRYDTLRATLAELTSASAVPIINENDATATSNSPDFVDNDQLAAIVALSVHAKALYLLTHVDGVFSENPERSDAAEFIREIPNINVEIMKRIARGKTIAGRGGMEGKLRAARIATAVGIPTTIMSGKNPRLLIENVLGVASHGTRCLPRARETNISPRDQWILSSQNTGASIELDTGAVEAVKKRKSLLAVGVRKLYGTFEKGECVELIDRNEETIALGKSTLSSAELQKLVEQPEKPYDTEVVHADYIFLLPHDT